MSGAESFYRFWFMKDQVMSHVMLGRYGIGFFLGLLFFAAVSVAAETEVSVSEKTTDKPWQNLPLPQLGVRVQDNAPLRQSELFVWVRMPQIEGASNVIDLMCYEDPRDLVYLGHRDLPGGVLELRHRRNSESALIIVTELTPQPGKVKIVTHLESSVGC